MAECWSQNLPPSPSAPPQAIYHTRVDDKGRLRLHRDFQAYLRSLPDQVFFVTTLDERIARSCPTDAGRLNARFFEECQEDIEALEDVAFSARVCGAESPLDKDGRVLIPPQLRRKLGIDNEPVSVGDFKGALDEYSEAVYQEIMQRASVNAIEKVKALHKLGLT